MPTFIKTPKNRIRKTIATLLVSLVLAACGGGDGSTPAPAAAANPAPEKSNVELESAVPEQTTSSVVVTATETLAPPAPERSAADVSFTQTSFAEGVAVDPATGTLYLGTGGDAAFAVLRATATETVFGNWLSATGILPGAPASSSFVVGTRVQGDTLFFCASNPLTAASKVWAYKLATLAKAGEYAMPAGFCNDLAFDAAGNLFATSNRTSAGVEAIYKLSASTVASGTATAASWSAWYSAPTGFALNGLAFDASGNRLLWVDNGSAGSTRIQASSTSGGTATVTTLVGSLTLTVDGLQINSVGNLVVMDSTTGSSGAKLIKLATGTVGTVTAISGGTGCATTVALYKADGWCSDSKGKAIRLAGAGNL